MQVQQLKKIFLRGENAYLNDDYETEATRIVNAVAFAASSGRVGDLYIKEGVADRDCKDAFTFSTDVPCGDRSIDVVSYVRPWSQMLRFEDLPRRQCESIFLPAQGWIGAIWYDGPLFHVTASGDPISVVAEGLPFALDVGEASDVVCSLNEFHAQRDISRLTSLVHATRMRVALPEGRKLLLALASFGLMDILNVVLARKAYPDSMVYLKHSSPYKSWPPAFKRLCQNLGIALYDVEEPSDALVFPAEIWREQLKGQERQLLAAANRVSALIPQRLFGEGQSSGFLP